MLDDNRLDNLTFAPEYTMQTWTKEGNHQNTHHLKIHALRHLDDDDRMP